jgi:hypothetical protein
MQLMPSSLTSCDDELLSPIQPSASKLEVFSHDFGVAMIMP